MTSHRVTILVAALAAGPLLACSNPADAPSSGERTAAQPAAPAGRPTVEEATAFVDEAEKRLLELWIERDRAQWVQSTYITQDTELLAAQANEEVIAANVELAKQATRFDGLELPYDTARKLKLLKLALTMPAPSNREETAELTRIVAAMEGTYGKGKYCPAGRPESECKDLQELSRMLAESRKPEELQEAWVGWHAISREMKRDYQRFVELSNKGASELGFPDTGALWRSKYDMPPDDFAKEVDRLWEQVRPLYEPLHCYVRAKLNAKYGDAVAPKTGPIPSHLLGNMWAQQWGNIYDLVEPGAADPGYSLTEILKQRKVDPVEMARYGERFFTSLGFDPLPQTFWERSMFTKPQDREVVCHASAWDIDAVDDLRIKMCIEPTEEDFTTIHHELGHNFYQRAYNQLPVLYRDTANDGFHEGDRRHGRALDHPEVPAGARLHLQAARPVEGHRPAAAPGARQGRVPALRPAHRPVALARLLGRHHPGQLQPGVVGPQAASTRASRRRPRAARPTSIPARSTTCRPTSPTRATSWPTSSSSSSTARCARRPATPGRSTAARSTTTRRRGRSSRRCWPWGCRAPGRRRWPRSPARARWTPPRSSTTSRRSRPGSTSRTRARRAGGERLVGPDAPAP